jgi:UPF0271 protein
MVDINCDMGEGMANDERLMPFISSANIACGYHAGDAATMRKTIRLCLQYGVALGAHPSFNDRKHFGRTEMQLSAGEITAMVFQQLERISSMCTQLGAYLHHIKPHGALYNMAAREPAIAKAIADAVVSFDKKLLLYGLSGSHLISEAERAGLKTVSEVFADRTYQPNGSLTARTQSDALIIDNAVAVQQVLKMILQQKVAATNGEDISIKAETICIHGDGEHAVDITRHLYEALLLHGIEIKAPQQA